MFIFITIMTYASFLYSINLSSPKANSSFYLVADIWLLNNFSSHCDLASGWDMKRREWKRKREKGKKGKMQKGKEKHYWGEKVRSDLSPLENVIWFEQEQYKAWRRIKAGFNHCISGWIFSWFFMFWYFQELFLTFFSCMQIFLCGQKVRSW